MDVSGGVAIFFILFLKGLLAEDLRQSNSQKIQKLCKEALQSLNSANDSSVNATIINPIVFNFISDLELAKIPVQKLVTQFTHFNENVNFATKVLQTLSNEQQRINFTSLLPDDHLNTDILRMYAEDLVKKSTNDETSLNILLKNRWLLLSAPPSFLLKLNRVYKVFLLFYIYYMAPVINQNQFWNHQSQLTKKTWSTIVLQPKYVFFHKQEYNLDSFPYILESANSDEIKSLFDHDGEKVWRFKTVHWNTLQVREIIKLLPNNANKNEFVACYLLQSLPEHVFSLQILPNLSICVQTLDDISLPMAIQLFEYIKASYNGSSSLLSVLKEKHFELTGKLLYSQSNTFLSQVYEEKIKLQAIKFFNSEKYSLLQAHFILKNSGIRNSREWALNLKGLLTGIPASFFLNFTEGLAMLHQSEILQYSQGNKMRALAVSQLYNKAETEDFSEYLETVLHSTNNEFISLISPLIISTNAAKILEFFQKAVKNDAKFARSIANLPSYVLTELWRRSDKVTYEGIFNDSYPLHLAILGLDCDTLMKVPTSDFLSILEFYNRQRTMYSKPFPKDLQKCTQSGFLSHLKLKSEVLTGKIDENLAEYMDLVDIRSVGGYILATLPTGVILESKFCDDIVKEIGRLSLPELMFAVPKQHLIDLTREFLKKKIGEDVIDVEHLLSLGNLIHFINEEYLEKIKPSALKFALEANAFDTRICASSSFRVKWENQLILAFGPVETWDENAVLNVGDMLITLKSSSLNKLRLSVRLMNNIADLVTSKYMEDIEWTSRPSPFYEVCSIVLFNEDEVSLYKKSIEELALFYAFSIEHQLKTVVRFNDIKNATVLEYVNQRFVQSESTDFSNGNDDPKTTEMAIDTRSGEQEVESLKNVPVTTSQVDPSVIFAQSVVVSSQPTSSNSDSDDDEDIKSTTNTRSRDVENYLVYPNESSTDASQSAQDSSSNGAEKQDTNSSFRWNFNIFDFWLPKMNTTVDEMNPATQAVTDVESFNATVITSETHLYQMTANSIIRNNEYFEASFSVLNSTVDSVGAIPHSTTAETVENEEFSRRTFFFSSTTAQQSNNADESTTPVTADSGEISTQLNVIEDTTEYQVDSSKPDGNVAIFTSNFSIETNVTESWSEYLNNNTQSLDTNLVTDLNTITTEYTTHYDVTYASSVSSNNVNLKSTVSDSERDIRSVKSYDQNIKSTTNISGKGVQDIVRNVFNNIKSSPKQDSISRRKRQVNKSQTLDNISCNTLKMLGSMSNFVIPFMEINKTETFNCIELLGNMNLDKKRKEEIWSMINSTMAEANLKFVAGKVLTALSKSDYEQFTFDIHSEWALELINVISENLKDSNFQKLIVDELVKKILNENMNYYDKKSISFIATATVALGNMICKLPNSTLEKILGMDKNFSNIWIVFHTLNESPFECLQRIADQVEKQFGKPTQWQPYVFTMIGPVAAAVRDIRDSASYAPYLPYLHKSAIERLEAVFKSDLSNEEIITKMPFTSALILLKKQGNSTEIVMKEEWFRRKKVQTIPSRGNRLFFHEFVIAFLILRFIV